MRNWERYPAFYYGIAVLAGIAFAKGVWIILPFFFLGKTKTRMAGFLLLALFSFFETKSSQSPSPPEHPLKGVGYFTIQKIRSSHGYNKEMLRYQGELNCFVTESTTYYDLPCFTLIEEIENRPTADANYVVYGTLSPVGHGYSKITIDKWDPVHTPLKLTELRFKLKSKLRSYLKAHIKDAYCYAFFASLATGEIENNIIAHGFSKTGLSHTLAISGFHYTWLMITIGGFLNLFLSKRKVAYLLLLFISVYFLFIGETPSLNRAWLAAIIYLIGFLIKESPSGINSLGIALLISLILDPNVVQNIGFQLSYAATFAILTLYPTFEKWSEFLLPKRPIDTLEKLSRLNKCVYIIAMFIRKSIVLTLVINIMTLPLVLYDFQVFPIASLFFNLFFPFAITISMILIILAVVLPFLGTIFLTIGEWYTSFWLDMIFYGSNLLQIEFWIPSLPLSYVILWLTGIGLLGFWLEGKRYQLTLIQSAS